MKSRKDLKVTDDYPFSQIMREVGFCKFFLEILMEIKIKKVIHFRVQKEGAILPPEYLRYSNQSRAAIERTV